jgi:hypothetical protein
MARRLVRASSRAPQCASVLLHGLGWVLVVLALAGPVPGFAQGPAPTRTKVESGTRWNNLTPPQREALRPLERDWPTIDTDRKQKWIEVAGRFPSLPIAERTRIQVRMAEWARLSPQERGQARLNFQQAKQIPAADRQAGWDAYQALPAEQKRQLAARAANPVPAGTSSPEAVRRPSAPLPSKIDRAVRDGSQAKSNIVPNPALAAPPKPVAPTVTQAAPGATTSLISKRPAPPAHQQTGLPKIAATPGFVDKATLLPQRGPQGAATRSAAASQTDGTPRP